MPKTPLDFGKGFYETKESAFASMDSLNMYPRGSEGDSVAPYYSVQTPSLESFGGVFTQGQLYRGSVVHRGDLYAIFSNRLFKFNTGTQNWDTQNLSIGGPVNVSGDVTKLAGIASNGIVIAIVVESANSTIGFGDFFYNPDTQVGTPMNQNPTLEYQTLAPNGSVDVTFLDGYFVMVGDDDNGSPRCYHSSLKTISEGKDFRDTDIVFLDAAEGNAAAVTSINGQLVPICTFHMEFYQNVGGANFAFKRLKGQTQYIGMPNRGFKVQYGDDLYFIGQRRTQRFSIYSLRNGPISNTPIDTYFEENIPESEFNSIRAWAHKFRGESFVGFNLITSFTPSDPRGRTFVYGLDTGLWHRRETQYSGALVADRPSWIQDAQTVENQLILLGDSALVSRASAVYSRDAESTYYGGDFGDLIGENKNRYEATAPFAQNDGNGVVTNAISIYVSGAANQDYELFYKDNPEETYKSLGLIELGAEKVGGAQTLLEWRRLGFTPTQRLYKIVPVAKNNASVAFRIIKAIANVDILNG